MAEIFKFKLFRVICDLGSPGNSPNLFLSDIRHCLQYTSVGLGEGGIKRYPEVNY